MKSISLLFLILTALLPQTDGKSDFEIEIVYVTSSKEVQMKCENGCAWTDLSFTLNSRKTVHVNAFGMTESMTEGNRQDEKLADFNFTVIRKSRGLAFTGNKGTKWIDLDFSCRVDCTRKLTQDGVFF